MLSPAPCVTAVLGEAWGGENCSLLQATNSGTLVSLQLLLVVRQPPSLLHCLSQLLASVMLGHCHMKPTTMGLTEVGVQGTSRWSRSA